MTRALVFDFGGVLFRWQPLELMRQVLPDLAGGDDAAARRLAASIFESFTPDSDWAAFDLGRVDEAMLAQRIGARLGVPSVRLRALIDAIPAHLQALADSVALVAAAKAAGHRLYFLSNMPLPYAAQLEQANEFIADFADGIFSARVGMMKPDPAIFRLAESRFALHPGETMFIDDHAGNVDAARRLGWQALRFESAAQCGEALRASGWLAPTRVS